VKRGDLPLGKLPMVVNNVAGGEIVEIGSEVKTLKIGDRVNPDPSLSCMERDCEYCSTGNSNYCPQVGFPGMCSFDFVTDKGKKLLEPYLDGAMAEYWKMPAYSCVPIPDNLSWDQAMESLCGVMPYAALVKSEVEPGEVILLNAVTGGVGAAAIKVAQLWHPSKIIVVGRNDERLKKLKSWAPDTVETINYQNDNIFLKVMEITKGKGANRFIDFSSNGADIVEQCLPALTRCGKAVFVGASPNTFNLVYPLFMNFGISLTGLLSYRSDVPEVVMKLASQGKLDFTDYITHKFPLSKANEAFEVYEKKIGNPLGVVVLPQE
jgi:threonine dehydrogenase-like Zn-dependent dehydrogenase